jgi:hypothetical protein
LSLSKFQLASSASELENFRPGYFELQIKEIGVFRNETSGLAVKAPTTLTKEAVEKKKPAMLKILFPIAKMLFNEKRYVQLIWYSRRRRLGHCPPFDSNS